MLVEAAPNFFGSVFFNPGMPMMLTDFLLTWELSLTMILAITMALVFLIHMAYGVGSNYPNNPNLEPVLVLLDVNLT